MPPPPFRLTLALLIACAATLLPACTPSKHAADSPPADSAPRPGNIESTDREATALNAAPANLREALRTAFIRADARREIWADCLLSCPPDMRGDISFLIAHMPRIDLATLDKDFVIENTRLAREAWRNAPWGGWNETDNIALGLPPEVYRNALLPYANLNEKRENWRRDFAARVKPLIDGCKTPGDAALAINAKLFALVKVQYHATKTPKPDQSPSESIAATYASCTGLSILLVDACRAVGVPARTVGTPQWVIPKGDANGNHAGNHTWVEIWDGQWHVLGASEVSPLDQVWFSGNAALAITRPGERMHAIYAAVWERNTDTTTSTDAPSAKHLPFPLVWDDKIDWVLAEDVTTSYADRREVKVTVIDTSVRSRGKPAARRLIFRQNGRLIADVIAYGSRSLLLSAGQKYDVEIMDPGVPGGSPPEHVERRLILVPVDKSTGIVVEVGE